MDRPVLVGLHRERVRPGVRPRRKATPRPDIREIEAINDRLKDIPGEDKAAFSTSGKAPHDSIAAKHDKRRVFDL